MTESANVTVIFADKSIKLFYVESRRTVISFKKLVAESIEIRNEKYFGFYIQDEQKNNYWLSDERTMFHYDFMKSNNNKPRLNFALKYFYQFDYWIADDVTQNLFYYQLKQQLYDGDFECESDRCFTLLAMTLQLNDEKLKSQQEIQKMNIISAQLFARHPSIDYCIDQIMIKYQEYESISKDELMKRFIVNILEIPYDLTHFFFAKNFNSSTTVIAINNNGFFESDKCNKSSIKLTYAWSEISNISYHKSRVNIDIQDTTCRSSSIRRKSTASSIYYEFSNPNLAKSLVYLAKDIFNFLSLNIETSMRIMNTSTPKRNPNNIKKHVSNTYSGKQEKYRQSAQNTFTPDNEATISRSSSRISLASSNYAGSALTNDTNSLVMDDESLNLPVNVPEKQQIYLLLNEKRRSILNELNKKIKDAVQNCMLEKSITKKMPHDFLILDPKGQIQLTKFTIRTPVGGVELSVFQSEKNCILEEIETLQNIIDKLKENEKKNRLEIKKKMEKINDCAKRMKILEEEHANKLYVMNSSRSNSMGCLYLYPNGDIPENHNGYSSEIEDNVAPKTEPRSRKNATIFTDRGSSESDTLKSHSEKYPRMKHSENNDISNSTSKSPFSIRPSNIKNPNHPMHPNSQFQRFTSIRSQLKGLPSKLQTTFIQKRYTDRSNSNSSVDSNSSSEIPEAICPKSNHSLTDSENSEDRIVPLRSSLTNNVVTHNFRDSCEVNRDRMNLPNKISNIKVLSRNIAASNNSHKRNSVSLEDLREDNSITDCSEVVKNTSFYVMKHHKDSLGEMNSPSKLTYHPSKKDGRPLNLTRGKQPSIIRKSARPTFSLERQ